MSLGLSRHEMGSGGMCDVVCVCCVCVCLCVFVCVCVFVV